MEGGKTCWPLLVVTAALFLRAMGLKISLNYAFFLFLFPPKLNLLKVHVVRLPRDLLLAVGHGHDRVGLSDFPKQRPVGFFSLWLQDWRNK